MMMSSTLFGRNCKHMENVFKNRNFVLVFLGALVSELGGTLYNFAVSFYILEISGNNAFLQGLYLAVTGITMLVITPFGGVLSDRLNRVKIMYVCDYLRGSAIIVATVLMLAFNTPDSHLVILFAMGVTGNVIGGIFSPASAALLPGIVNEDQFQQANSYFTMKSSFISILGVIAAGILYAELSVTTLFFIVGVCFCLSGVSEMFIKVQFTAGSEKMNLQLVFSDMKDGLAYILGKKAICIFMCAMLFINFFFSPVFSNFMPLFIKTDLVSAPSYLFDSFLTPELWSSVFSLVIGVSTIITSVILSTKKQEDKCGFKIAVRICVLTFFMIAITAGYRVFVAGNHDVNPFLIIMAVSWIAVGAVTVLINIPANTVLLKIVDRDKLGKVSSITNVLTQGLIPLASVLAGIILQKAGCTALLTVCTTGFALTALIMLFNKYVKEL